MKKVKRRYCYKCGYLMLAKRVQKTLDKKGFEPWNGQWGTKDFVLYTCTECRESELR
jgi:RNase P subunit RPR2